MYRLLKMNKSLNQKIFLFFCCFFFVLFFFHSIKMSLLALLGPFTDHKSFAPLATTYFSNVVFIVTCMLALISFFFSSIIIVFMYFFKNKFE